MSESPLLSNTFVREKLSSLQPAGQYRAQVDDGHGPMDRIAPPLRPQSEQLPVHDTGVDHSHPCTPGNIESRGKLLSMAEPLNPSNLSADARASGESSGLTSREIRKDGVHNILEEVKQIEVDQGIESKASLGPSLPCENSSKSNKPKIHFMDLPAELRNMIYRHVLLERDPISLDTPLPSINQISQQVRQESLSIHCLENTFRLTIRNFEFERLESFLTTFKLPHHLQLQIWHQLDADTPTLKANLRNWFEQAYRHGAPILTHADNSTIVFDQYCHAHRIAVLFGILQTCKKYEASWEFSDEILTQAIAGLGVCGER